MLHVLKKTNKQRKEVYKSQKQSLSMLAKIKCCKYICKYYYLYYRCLPQTESLPQSRATILSKKQK